MPIRSLGLLALLFVLLFALQLLAVMLPFQPFDPAWQWLPPSVSYCCSPCSSRPACVSRPVPAISSPGLRAGSKRIAP